MVWPQRKWYHSIGIELLNSKWHVFVFILTLSVLGFLVQAGIGGVDSNPLDKIQVWIQVWKKSMNAIMTIFGRDVDQLNVYRWGQKNGLMSLVCWRQHFSYMTSAVFLCILLILEHLQNKPLCPNGRDPVSVCMLILKLIDWPSTPTKFQISQTIGKTLNFSSNIRKIFIEVKMTSMWGQDDLIVGGGSISL